MRRGAETCGHVTSLRGATALVDAALCGHKATVEVQVDRGADPDSKDEVSQARLLPSARTERGRHGHAVHRGGARCGVMACWVPVGA